MLELVWDLEQWVARLNSRRYKQLLPTALPRYSHTKTPTPRIHGQAMGQALVPIVALFGQEMPHRATTVGLAWAQHGAGELRLIWRIGEMLGFEAQPGMVMVAHAVLTHQCAIEEVTRIELHARLGGIYRKHAPTVRVGEVGGQR